MDSGYLLEALAGGFMDVVQYNEDNRAFEVSKKKKGKTRGKRWSFFVPTAAVALQKKKKN